MNKKTWNSLPANAKASFTKHGGLGMARRGGAAYDAATQKIRKQQLAAGKITFVPADKALMARYRKDADAIHAAWVKKTPNGAKVFEVYKKALAEVRMK